MLGEYNGSTGALLVNYWYAGERLFKKSGLTSQLFLSDRLSVRLALSDNGTVAGRQEHLPFGELRSVSQKWPRGQGLRTETG